MGFPAPRLCGHGGGYSFGVSMELEGKRFLVVGASGELGSRFARELARRGARVALTARDASALEGLAGELKAEAIELEITDADSREAAIDAAADALGALDGIVIASGTVAFGPVGTLDAGIGERMVEVNAIGPMELLGSVVERLEEGGAILVLSAVVAEFPTAGMAAYSASKAALSAYVTALRRERRRQLSTVLDVRPGHMDTGFSDRALAGEPPKMPEPEDPDELVSAAVDALVDGKRELAYDPVARKLSAS